MKAECLLSNAEVKVYLPGKSAPEVFRIGSGFRNVWTVFEINHGKLKEINQAGD